MFEREWSAAQRSEFLPHWRESVQRRFPGKAGAI
jgi:hypothetical protein